MYYKTTLEGEDHVCEAVQNYAENYARKRAEESYNEGVNNGKAEGSVNSLASLIISGDIPLDLAIKSLGLSKDVFISIASRLGYKL